MTPSVRVFLCLALMLGSMEANVSAAEELTQQPLSKQYSNKSAIALDSLTLPELDMSSLRAQVANKSNQPAPLKFAESYVTSKNTVENGTWQVIRHQGQDMMVWRYVIESANAYSLNFGFSKYFMPAGGSLYLYADGYESLIGPFTNADNEDHGQLWTPIVSAKRVTIEINVPLEEKDHLDIELSHVGQAFLDIDNLQKEISILKSGSCNIDVVCPASAGWEDQIRSVARYIRSGTSLCTGAAINNTYNNGRPYFLTADHCGFTPANAPSIVAYWNYENSTCRTPGSIASGSGGNGSFSQFNTGAIFRAASSITDFALLEFDDPILPAANVYLAGWDRTSTAPGSAVAIHHPRGEEKRISFENNALSLSAAGGGPGTGSNYFRVADWDAGTTEGGSSGSPLFSPQKRIIGQLLGGFAACGNDLPDWYGRFGRSWVGGGGSSSGLQNWLDQSNEFDSQTINGREAVKPDAYESDDSSAAAKTISPNSSQNRTIHETGNQDWVRFTLSQATGVEILVTGMGPETNLTMIVRDGNAAGMPVLDSRLGTNPRITLDTLAAGDYFILLSPSTSIGPAEYTLTLNEIGDDIYEPDDSSGTATAIALGDTQDHTIYEVGDEDWISFVVSEETDVEIRTSGSAGGTQMWLYDQGLGQIDYDSGGGVGNFSLIQQTLSPGTYFVRVLESGSTQLVSYRLSVAAADDDFLLLMLPAIISGTKND